MMGARLEPVPPTPGESVRLDDRTRCIVGTASDADVRLDDPHVRAHHCRLECRDDRWLILDGDPTVTVNGHALTGPMRLFDRDVITLSSAHQWEFVSGERRTVELPIPGARQVPRRRRPTDGFELPRRPFPWRVAGMVSAACLLAAVALFALWYFRRATADPDAILSDRQAIRFDSLLVVAYDHLERGNSLLELGIRDDAAQEFARGINTLALSDLRDHPQVRPRILALESSVAAMYRERRLVVPDAYVGARSSMSADKIRTAALSRNQFSHAFDLVSGAFRLRFGASIVVVGRDHAEHLTLYGEGGALDLRSLTMSAEQVAFVITQCRSYGIRVKDFSQDSILRRQVDAAVRAGLPDRAGTGLHLHIDRFADRRDRWTIGAISDRPPLSGSGQTSRNLSRVTPDKVNSDPSSSRRGSPRSTASSSTDVPFRLESIR
ncbi:MAG: FHA domain-containing protein [Gemmatimonadaceae bacterium]|nr:FHA domain-containing protein [Gemmatimonadaceae bacterium]